MASADVSEYDAFGPWVDEVTRPQDVPRLYRAHPIDFERTSLVLKIPRDIERRNASPAMHLYDGLVILEERSVTLLSRTGDRYSTRSVLTGSLVALVDSVHLLDGRLELYTVDGPPLIVRYNAASHARLADLAQRIRESILLDRAGDALPVPDGHGSVDLPHARRDYGLFGGWAALQSSVRGLELCAAHPSEVLRPIGGMITHLLHRLRPMVLSAAIVGVSPYEVHAVHRRGWLTRGFGEDLSMAHTVLFRSAGALSESSEHPDYEGVESVRVGGTGGATPLELAVSPDSGIAELIAAALAPLR